ncbi:MAG: hypothetical protein ACE37F_17315 [Nannocystaceae bacterium]|nr:hypothetical protein [bacterium]
MPAGEAYDVVVVRDPTMTVGAVMALSRDLAHLSGVKQADVELALQQGRFVVYAGLESVRVEAATAQLRAMGAVVHVRPAERVSGDMLEPDLEQPRVGRFDGAVAHFSDGDLGLGSGAFNTGAGFAPDDDGIGRVLPDDPASGAPGPPPPHAQMEPRTPSDSFAGDEMQALAAGLDAAAFDAPEIQTIDGMDGAAFDAAEEAAKKEAAPAPVAPPPPSGEEASLALDVGGAGTGAPQAEAAPGLPQHGGPGPGQSLQLDRPHQSASALPQPQMTSAAYSGSYSGGSSTSIPRPSLELDEERGLLFADSIANTLGLIAACSLLCLFVAFGITRATKREPVVALEDELAESYRSPLDVELGKMRAPAELEEELETLYSSARFQFLLVLSLGIPIGLGLGRIRR